MKMIGIKELFINILRIVIELPEKIDFQLIITKYSK
jgi:hypothetical protein